LEKCDGSNNFSILFNPNLFPAELNCFQTGYSWKTSHADNQYFYWLENNFVASPFNLGIDWPSLTNCYGGEIIEGIKAAFPTPVGMNRAGQG